MLLTTKSAIMAAADLKTEEVPVPEWGGEVLVQSLSAAERDRFEQSCVTQDKKGNQRTNLANFRARFVALVLVDESGRRIFTDTDVLDLGTKSAAALERVFKAGQRLSGMSDEDVEELTKDFAEGRDETSTTD